MTRRRPLEPVAAPATALLEPLAEAQPPAASTARFLPGALDATTSRLPGLGWAHDRHTLAAARRGFGELRRQCVRAAGDLPPTVRRELLEPIQRATDIGTLAPLHARLLAALMAAGPAAERQAREVAAAWRASVCGSADLQPFGSRLPR